MSPSSASHWPVFMPISSPPDPQPSCIDLGPGKTPMDKTAYNQGCNQHTHFNLKPDRFIALLILSGDMRLSQIYVADIFALAYIPQIYIFYRTYNADKMLVNGVIT